MSAVWPGADAHIVVVGAGMAGLSAVEAMRMQGFEGAITLFEATPDLPYERPPLSKSLNDLDAIPLIVPTEFYARNRVELRLDTSVVAVSGTDREVLLSGGELVRADAVVLATGVAPRQLPVDGADLANVLALRDLADARRLSSRLEAGGPIVVVGGGFIGLEVAAVARSRGLEVTVVESQALPLEGILGVDVASFVSHLHRERGVRLLTGRQVHRLLGSSEVEEVELDQGERLPAATVIVGIGVIPRDELARNAGVACDDGIVVDRFGRTSVPWIWAAGDVARQVNRHLHHPQRVEHWEVARQHGLAVGASVVGASAECCEVPYFWSDQYGLKLQMYGRSHPSDTVVVREGSTSERFLACWLRNDRIVAAAGLDEARDIRSLKTLVEARPIMSPDVLASRSTNLRALARGVAE